VYSKVSEVELIRGLRAGSHEALTEIFRRYWRPLYINVFSKLRSHQLAEEIVQELFTELWDKRETLFSKPLDDVRLASYLNRAVKNKALNQLRKQVYDQKYWEYCRRHLPISEDSACELVEYNDLQEKLKVAVERLSEKTRQIFVLHKLKGIPVLQISRQLKLSEKAIGYHLTKSVRELKVHLRDFI
jgi:RNA polymerase sigma-70 factor (ECF subfamily)